MTEPTQHSVNCSEIEPDLVEFALGTSSGRSRSRVVSHLSTCSKCTTEIETLTAVADAMLELTPDAEPPLGFEHRLLERLHAEPIRSRRRDHSVMFAVAAAFALIAVLALTVGGATPWHSTNSSRTTSGKIVNARLVSQGRDVGQVFVTAGSPAWIYMTFDDSTHSGPAWCRVTLQNGRVVTAGQFSLVRGYGAWAAQVHTAGSRIVTAQVIGASGTVLATAHLSA